MKVINPGLLQKAVERIVEALHPELVYLYGSQACGEPGKDSDVDLFVLVRDSLLPPHRRGVEAYRALRGLFLPAEGKGMTRIEFE